MTNDPIEKTIDRVNSIIKAAEVMLKTDDLFGCEEMIIEEVIALAKGALQSIKAVPSNSDAFLSQIHMYVPAARASAFADVLKLYLDRE